MIFRDQFSDNTNPKFQETFKPYKISVANSIRKHKLDMNEGRATPLTGETYKKTRCDNTIDLAVAHRKGKI